MKNKLYEIEGFDKLNKMNKSIFNIFLKNFFNYHNKIEPEVKIYPKSIYLIEETEICIKEENREYLTYIGSELKLLDYEIPTINTLTELDNIKYKDFEKIKMSSKQYLKFKYELKYLNGTVKNEYVYIFGENEWH